MNNRVPKSFRKKDGNKLTVWGGGKFLYEKRSCVFTQICSLLIDD